ncbi:MAG: hypothetical protein V2J16_02975 [Thermoleophilia bacterium]|jgi:hypothetical protein|nr:hypothetical protein [Thermoleophilia bacterium]
MADVRRSVDVPAPLDEVAGAWEHFLDGVLTGRRRLACDEIACVNAVDIGAVSFEDAESGGTRVTFKATVPDDLYDDERLRAERDLLDGNVARDLVLFWDYIESGDYKRERATHETALAQHEDELRRTHARRQGVEADQDTISLRRSARS